MYFNRDKGGKRVCLRTMNVLTVSNGIKVELGSSVEEDFEVRFSWDFDGLNHDEVGGGGGLRRTFQLGLSWKLGILTDCSTRNSW